MLGSSRAMQLKPTYLRALLQTPLAGAVYGASLFCTGFLLGVPRTLLLAPWIGKQAAIFIELPVMFIIAWLLSAYLMAAWKVKTNWRARLPVIVFAILIGMSLEVALGMTLQRQTFVNVINELVVAENRLVLVGQLLIFAIPLVQTWALRK
jgi:hypothetical protein